MKKLGMIIQARTGSSRLPRKMILPFYKDKSILDIILSRLTIVSDKRHVPVTLATTELSDDDVLVGIAKKYNISCFRGSSTDVLKRFIDAAEQFHYEGIIRICGDNPFLSADFLTELILEIISDDDNPDYISFCTSTNIPAIRTHYGFFCEYVRFDALEAVTKVTVEEVYHEHVTNYIYSHPHMFKCRFIKIPTYIEKLPVRLTIDTQTDFEISRNIYNYLLINKLSVEPENIIDYLETQPELLKLMQIEINKNIK